METVLEIHVVLDQVYSVNGNHGDAIMILFHGDCTGDFFKGRILPGGVDTQKKKNGENRDMSARYILEGEDYRGKACHIFIENHGVMEEGEPIVTRPTIYTDSDALKWMEDEVLTGHVEGDGEGKVLIRICRNE